MWTRVFIEIFSFDNCFDETTKLNITENNSKKSGNIPKNAMEFWSNNKVEYWSMSNQFEHDGTKKNVFRKSLNSTKWMEQKRRISKKTEDCRTK